MLFELGNNSLTHEEEKGFLVNYKENNNQEALERLMAHGFKAVVNQAYKFSGFNVRFEDLIQEGMMGLLDAIKRFDISKGVRLLSYARLVIRHKMIIFTAKFHISVDLSPAVRTANSDLKKVNSLRNVSAEKIDRLESVNDPEELCYKKELQTIVQGLVDKYLNDNQKVVVSRRILTEDPDTLKKIGSDLSLSSERIRQIEAKSLEIIKDRIKSISDLRSLLIND